MSDLFRKGVIVNYEGAKVVRSVSRICLYIAWTLNKTSSFCVGS